MLKTERLILRQWTEDDFPPFADMCSDKSVMEFFPSTLTQEQSVEMANHILSLIDQRGWGLWAVEIPHEQKFIGFTGLHIPKHPMPFLPCVEVGWRLAKDSWGNGYATEAAKVAVQYAFTHLGLEEVVSFTTKSNIRSINVMRKLGMHDSKENFMHPAIETTHPLCEHVLYKMSKQRWQL